MPEIKTASGRGTYEHVYRFSGNYQAMCLTWIIVCVVSFVILAPHFLLDPAYEPPHLRSHGSYGSGRGKGRGIVALILLFLSLPVWIKFPSALLSVVEFCRRKVRHFVWSLDTQPDFAIGRDGIFGLHKFRYVHVPWSQVTGLSRYFVPDYGQERIKSLRFSTSQISYRIRWLASTPLSLNESEVKVDLKEAYGFNLSEIQELTQKYAPHVAVRSFNAQEKNKEVLAQNTPSSGA